MAFTGALGTQLNQVVVTLTIGHKARQLEQFGTATHLIRIQANRADEYVNPFILRKLRAACNEALKVET